MNELIPFYYIKIIYRIKSILCISFIFKYKLYIYSIMDKKKISLAENKKQNMKVK